MKKFLTKLCAGILALGAMLGIAACDSGNAGGGDSVNAKFYTPDGAPALSIAKIVGEKDVKYEVVDPKTIASYVTGANPKADLCILPITAASKLLGTGEKYTMLATVTHGNLYLISSNPSQYNTASELGLLTGKSVGIVQPNNVPGLTFAALLENANVCFEWTELSMIGSGVNGIGLMDIVQPSQYEGLPFDAILQAEPTVSKLIKESAGTTKPLQIVADIQKLYGDGNGFPQAVLVVKNTFLNEHKDWVKAYLTKFENSIKALNEETNMNAIITALNGVRTPGLEPAVTAENMSAEIIQRCNVKFVSAANSKTAVTSYLANLKGLKNPPSNAAVGQDVEVADKFFFVG